VWHPSENKFAGQSTSSSDYTAKPVQQRHLHAAEKAVITADDRDFSTNNGSSYQAHEAQVRYVSSLILSPDIYRSSYYGYSNTLKLYGIHQTINSPVNRLQLLTTQRSMLQERNQSSLLQI